MTLKLRKAVDDFKRDNGLRNEKSIAEGLGIHNNRWNQIKNGNLIPNKKEIMKISGFFKKEPDYLFGTELCKMKGVEIVKII